MSAPAGPHRGPHPREQEGVDIVVVRSAGDAITVDVKGIAKKYDWPANNLVTDKPNQQLRRARELRGPLRGSPDASAASVNHPFPRRRAIQAHLSEGQDQRRPSSAESPRRSSSVASPTMRGISRTRRPRSSARKRWRPEGQSPTLQAELASKYARHAAKSSSPLAARPSVRRANAAAALISFARLRACGTALRDL